MIAVSTKKKSRVPVLFIVLVAVALGVFALLAFTGLLGKINRASRTTSNYVPPSQETFEATAEGPDTLKPDEVIFDVDKIGMMDDDSIKNILLIGQDRREGEGRQRSDSMIICSVNSRDTKITLVSLMRDMYVPIPGYSANRINAAYAFGGMDLLDETIEQDFGIPIHGNVEVDFDGFMDSLEVIGDLELELSGEEAAYLNNGDWFDMDFDDSESWELKEGINKLTPAQALAFSRMRHVGNSDWERTDRQRRVIMAAFAAIGNSSTAKMLKIADDIFPYITTDLSNSELLSYVKTVSVVGISQIESYRLPADGHYSSETISGMSVLVPDLGMNSEILKKYLYGSEINEELATINYVPPVITRPEPTYAPVETYEDPAFYEETEEYYEEVVVTEVPVEETPAETPVDPVYEDPVPTEEPAPEQPAEQPVEEPAPEQPAEQPVEEPAPEQPAAEAPPAEAPAAEAPSAEAPVDAGAQEESSESE